MEGKKKGLNEPVANYRAGKACRPIRLTPCSTDYATAAELTARMLGMGEIDGSRLKPSRSILSLLGRDSG